jgi:AGZA family xanthine/uracil permease-like MFS transporter
MILVLTWFGVIALMLALIPVIAILPILLYIGMLIGAQAFQETPRRHAPAIILALVPQIAAWGKTQIDGALHAAGTDVSVVGFDKLGQQGVLYQGLQVMGGGATLAGVILGSITVFIIEREFDKASYFALAGTVLTFFGFIHGEAIGVGQSITVSVSYLLVAAVMFWVAKFGTIVAPAPERHHEEGIDAHGMPTAAAE